MKRTLMVAALSVAVQGIMAAGVTPTAEAQKHSSSQRGFDYYNVSESLGPAALLLIQTDLFRQIVDTLNRDIRLPTTVLIEADRCRAANAHYGITQGVRTIAICLGLVDEVARWDLSRIVSGEINLDQPAVSLFELEEDAENVLRFTVLHEVGHALIDVFRLPVLGRGEDAADEFAAWYLFSHGDWFVGGAGDWFAHLATRSDSGAIVITPDEAGGSHSTPIQRAYFIDCLYWGAIFTLDSALIDSIAIPGRTGRECRDEWTRVSSTWASLLGPHLRQLDDFDRAAGRFRHHEGGLQGP